MLVFNAKSKNINVMKNIMVGQLRLTMPDPGYSLSVCLIVCNKYVNVNPRMVSPRGIFENVPDPIDIISHISSLLSGLADDTKPCAITEIPAASNNPAKYTIPFKSLLNMEDMEKKHNNTNGDSRKNRRINVAKLSSIIFT